MCQMILGALALAVLFLLVFLLIWSSLWIAHKNDEINEQQEREVRAIEAMLQRVFGIANQRCRCYRCGIINTLFFVDDDAPALCWACHPARPKSPADFRALGLQVRK